ncbi:chalcone isomerase family protein [Thiomicrorhabdus sp. Milos-T2]|uniref:chalcone isomerase family protein n=1 Tax=Thiomicrorhabdus sp. Milos-T2 TaxID=90814 RepID=UPI00131A18B9|nr:chalcone isomerase family protein [Thiomicrorhabdus sp. Milos-T2]
MNQRYMFLKSIVFAFFTSLFLLTANQASAASAASASDNKWFKVSEGTATWLFFDIYQASLYVDSSKKSLPNNFLEDSELLKLKLCYLKEITPDIFIEGANKVLPKDISPQLKKEVERLHMAYKAVKPGDCYTLKYTPQDGTTLLLNDVPIFSSSAPGFKAVYFGIWLGENPLSEDLKSNLIGN